MGTKVRKTAQKGYATGTPGRHDTQPQGEAATDTDTDTDTDMDTDTDTDTDTETDTKINTHHTLRRRCCWVSASQRPSHPMHTPTSHHSCPVWRRERKTPFAHPRPRERDKVGGEGGRARVLCSALDVGQSQVAAAAQDSQAVVERGQQRIEDQLVEGTALIPVLLHLRSA